MSIRVLLADDHDLMRAGLRSLLESQHYEVVGEASDGRAAVAAARRLHPQVIVMDISMPDLNGIEATRQVLHAAPEVKVVALSVHHDTGFVAEMLKAGAKAYLLKNSAATELTQAIKAVMSGRTYLSSRLNQETFKSAGARSAAEPDMTPPHLSPREREVLQLLAEGKGNKQIASALQLSVKTVESHRANIVEKLGLHSVAELTKYAIRCGITGLQ